jgi:hypothetical protein
MGGAKRSQERCAPPHTSLQNLAMVSFAASQKEMACGRFASLNKEEFLTRMKKL